MHILLNVVICNGVYDDALVAIDFGRSFVRLADDDLIKTEHAKLLSHVSTCLTIQIPLQGHV